MPPQFSHGDAIREYLTGSTSDGGVQTNPLNSFGHYRSATEAVSLGIVLINALTNVTVLYAGGGNGPGSGTLTALDSNNLIWQPPGAIGPGAPAFFSGAGVTGIVEGQNVGQYLRVTVTTPLTPGTCTVQLSVLANNVFGADDISTASAISGISLYHATIVRNESGNTVSGFQRWLASLGTLLICNSGLGGSGAGTILVTNPYNFANWPSSGWCEIQSSGNVLKEVVYYTSRTNALLTVPVAGRGLLGTTAQAGNLGDLLYPISGTAIAIDTAGVQAFGSSIQTIANSLTPPNAVTWNVGILAVQGLQIGTLLPNQQAGIWIWKQIPAGVTASPSLLNQFQDSFNAF